MTGATDHGSNAGALTGSDCDDPARASDVTAGEHPGKGADAAGRGTPAASPPELDMYCYGTPGPQGSKRHVGNGVMIESSKKVAPWRSIVREAGMWTGLHHKPLDGPLRVEMVFTLAKPKRPVSHRPDRYPDLSKLARSTEDALTSAGVWADDARVVEYSRLAKVYPGDDPDALDSPGVVIRIWQVQP